MVARPAAPLAAEIADRLDRIVDALLAPLLAKDRMQREMLPSPAERLRQQPAVLAGGVALLLAAFLMAVLAAVPAAWLAGDIRQYNAAVDSLERDTDLREVLQEFSAIADTADDRRVKSAAYYNLGSLLVHPSQSRMSREQRRDLLQAIFHADISLDLLLHELELDAEFELITLLSETTRQYVQAEQALQAAITAGPYDSDMGRNLELLSKTRQAIARSLARLIAKAVVDAGSQEALSQTVIDLKVLMETELPDDYARLDEGKDDRNYFIMERF